MKDFPSLPSSPGSTQSNFPQATITTLPLLRRLPLSSHRFLFQHWGHWMDWSPAFLLVISLLVTYASVLLVGPGAAALTPQQPFFLPAQLYPLTWATKGRVGGRRWPA